MKLKSILYILMLLPFLWSCNNEDDVEEIFASGTWHVVDFYGKANWDKRNGEPKYNAMAHNPDKAIATEGRKALDIIHGFNITFKADGTFTGRHGYWVLVHGSVCKGSSDVPFLLSREYSPEKKRRLPG